MPVEDGGTDEQLERSLTVLPAGPLTRVLCLLGSDRGGAGIRCTCTWLRDTFDACNLRLVLGGKDQQADDPEHSTHSHYSSAADEAWHEPPGLHARLLALVRGSPEVTNLCLRPQLTWMSLPEVLAASGPRLCSRLEHLVLKGRDDVTDLAPLAHCPQLLHLDLLGCKAVRDLTPLSSCTQLQYLRLSGCTAVADLAPLASCTELRRLHLAGCTITDLTPLASCTALEHLDLKLCTNLASIEPLQDCARLQLVDMYGCNKAPRTFDSVLSKLGLANVAGQVLVQRYM